MLAIKTRSTCYTKRPGVLKKQRWEIQRYQPFSINSANIKARKLIEIIKAEIKIRDTKIQALQEMIDSLEQKINEQDRVLSSIERI